MSRVSRARFLGLAEELDEAERQLIFDMDKVKLATHRQLAALVAPSEPTASAASQARAMRRRLARLTELGVLARLERTIGGRRAGSQGHVYYLGPVGQRLMAYWQGQGFIRGRIRPEPGSRYVRHRLSVSELYTQARTAERAGEVEVLAFDAEPDCWRAFSGRLGGQTILKPDAFVRLGVGAYEDVAFIEVDLGTESCNVVAKKARAYVDYWRLGQEQTERGVFPRVLLLTNSERRRDTLVDVCGRLPAEAWQLFTVSTLDRGLRAMGERIEADAQHPHDPEGGAS
jgi:hypothetical protein